MTLRIIRVARAIYEVFGNERLSEFHEVLRAYLREGRDWGERRG